MAPIKSSGKNDQLRVEAKERGQDTVCEGGAESSASSQRDVCNMR
jgi:hypothetical protein